MVPLYRYFGRHWEHCLDWSDNALWELYENESFGTGRVSSNNGFAHGRKWMDVTVAQWREELGRTLFRFELYTDPDLIEWHWWLDKVLGHEYQGGVSFNDTIATG